MLKRVFLIAVAALSFLSVVGCASRNVAIVMDNNGQAPEVFDALSHHVTTVNEDDRLVVLGIQYKNKFEFRNEVHLRQYPKADEGRSGMSIYPNGEEGDLLVLVKFKADAGDTVYIQPLPCIKRTRSWCIFTSSPNENHVKLQLPPPGNVTYGGHLVYEIEDQFPDRGTQNHPLVKGMAINDESEKDIPAAIEKWSLLKGRNIQKLTGVTQKGRAAVFVVGSKEFEE